MGDHYEVEVIGNGQTRIGKISKEDLPIFEAHYWHAALDKNIVGTCILILKGRGTGFHRLIKPWQGNPVWKYVDHKDRNGLNNQRCNMRDGGDGKNERNQKMHKNNTSGVNGVYLVKKKNGDPKYWRASWPENGKRRTRNFNIEKYGFDEAKQKAIAVRRAARCTSRNKKWLC